MFLDERIYQRGVDVFKNEGQIPAIKAMMNECLEESGSALREYADDKLIPVVFKRINTAWNIAVKRHKKDGYDIAVIDGFLIFMSKTEKFKCVHHIAEKLLKNK